MKAKIYKTIGNENPAQVVAHFETMTEGVCFLNGIREVLELTSDVADNLVFVQGVFSCSLYDTNKKEWAFTYQLELIPE